MRTLLLLALVSTLAAADVTPARVLDTAGSLAAELGQGAAGMMGVPNTYQGAVQDMNHGLSLMANQWSALETAMLDNMSMMQEQVKKLNYNQELGQLMAMVRDPTEFCMRVAAQGQSMGQSMGQSVNQQGQSFLQSLTGAASQPLRLLGGFGR